MSRFLDLVETEDLEERILGRFRLAGPFVGRDLRVFSQNVRLGGSVGRPGLPGIPAGDEAGPQAPTGSYQWLFFEEISGVSPAGPQTFEFLGPPIGFVGAVTEVDVSKEMAGGAWQMQVGIDGVGPIFRTSQADEQLFAEGFWRPIPLQFWPETEGIVFPLPSAGLRPKLVFRRPDDVQPNLLIKVLIVAHPIF